MANLIMINPSSGDKTASLFASPDSSDTILKTVQKGSLLKVIGTSGNYYMVEYDNGQPNEAKGGTGMTGTMIAYPSTPMYDTLSKTNAIGTINNGTAIEITDDSNTAIFKVKAITTEGAKEGYIDSKTIYRDEAPAFLKSTKSSLPRLTTTTNNTRTGKVIAKIGLKTRSGPGTNYSYIGAFNYGASVTIHDTKNGWDKVSGTSGWGQLTNVWVSAEYVQEPANNNQAAVSTSDGTPVSNSSSSTAANDWANYSISASLQSLDYTANDEYYKQLAEKYLFALGAPPKYNMDIDIQYMDDITSSGRVYSKTILSNPSILSICPGKVEMFPNKIGEEKDSIVQAMLDAAEGNSELTEKIKGDKQSAFSGKLYKFIADTENYAHYLNALCRASAIMLGIGDELMADTSTKLKNFDYAYWSVRKKYSPAFAASGDNDTSLFRKFVSGLFKSGKRVVTNAVEDTMYINFFLNGNETSVSESISNSTTESPLSSVFSTVSSVGTMINYFTNGGYDLSNGAMDDALKAISDSTGSTLSGILNLSENFMKGGRMILPKMVEGSHYEKSINCSMKFVSPYGNKYSVFLKCIVPICHILAMALPRQLSDNMYTFPFLVRCSQIGLFNVDLGIISSVRISRGGSEETSWTVDSLTTEWDVELEITPLVDDLMISTTEHPVLFCKNEMLLDYLSNFCGFDMMANNLETKADMMTAFIKNKVLDIPHSIENILSDKLFNKLNPLFKM